MQVGPKSNDKCPFGRETLTEEKTHLEKRRRQCVIIETEINVATSQGTPGARRNWKRQGMNSPQESLEGVWLC